LPTLWSVFCNAFAVCHLFPGSTFFNGESFGGWARDTVREVGMISGCFLLIERTLFECLGGFDPAFFMYGEDADLCARARQLGARPLFTPHAAVVHLGRQSDTAGKISSYLMGARIELARRLLPPYQAWLAERLVVVGVALRRLIYGALCIAVRDGARVEKADAWRFTWNCRHLWRHGPIPEPLSLGSGRAEALSRGGVSRDSREF
jgi:GT2 family glycosyltransferase